MPDPDPIFVVGLPRSGSTLIEQILASHSLVEGTQELSDIQRIVLGMRGSYPGLLTELALEDFRRLGERYLTDTRAYRKHKPFFIDKMPNNFRHIGLIHLMMPKAKIIDVRRIVVSARQAQSRSASRFSATGSSSGGTTSLGSARLGTVWPMR